MNSHLNLFRSYSREDRNNQLENDLTRALALCLSEDTLFLHEVLKYVLENRKGTYEQLFGQLSSDANFEIDIQRDVSKMDSFSHLFAVSLSGCKMDCNSFFSSKHDKEYDPITDLIIMINDIAVIFEVKPNNTDCTNQLYNQALNALGTAITTQDVTPVDLNWKDLMDRVIKISYFQKAIGSPSRFLSDFIEIIQHHNAAWLPILPFKSQTVNGNTFKLYERLKAAIHMSGIPSIKYSDRTGIAVNYPWASEILFDFLTYNGNSYLRVNIWPGNTKGQGRKLFPQTGEPKFKDKLLVSSVDYKVKKAFHIKFTHFQKYIAHLEGDNNDLVHPTIINAENFRKISGRKKKNNWDKVEHFFDQYFKNDFAWKDKSKWKDNFLNSNRSYFDLTLGYHLYIDIPFTVLQQIDVDKEDYTPIISFLKEIESQFKNIV